jgi:DNA topoisomerase-1
VKEALQAAAAALGNTITVCRKYYVHPLIVDLFLADKLAPLSAPPRSAPRGLSANEQALLSVLKRMPANGT